MTHMCPHCGKEKAYNPRGFADDTITVEYHVCVDKRVIRSNNALCAHGITRLFCQVCVLRAGDED